MPARVIDLEWSEPLPEALLHEPGNTLALVRLHGRPAGLARLVSSSKPWNIDQMRAAIAEQVELEGEPGRNFLPTLAISIVVCTRNRPEMLYTCLEALRPLAAQGHDIVVVDNAPASQVTAQLLRRYPYRYLVEPEPGLNRARNRGLASARQEIVAFTDDDCLPDPCWAKTIAAHFTDPGVGAVTGLVMPFELSTEAQEAFESYCANRRIFRPRSFHRRNTPPSTAGAAGLGANMAFRRETLLQSGGFDERLDGGTPTLSGGDTDMFARILERGETIVYRPEVLVWHRHPSDRAVLRRVIFGYGAGLFAFLTKRFIERGDLQVLITAPRWLAGPVLKAGLRRLTGKPSAAPDLLWFEAMGALAGPGRFLKARKASKRAHV
jgi:glycosyltransferase involved in cell wall biosynthesis